MANAVQAQNGDKVRMRECLNEVVETYQQRGLSQALDLLSRYHESFAADGLQGSFETMVWREAQIRSGKNDAEWAMRIFLWLHDKRAKSVQASSLTYNIISNMWDAGYLAEARTWIQALEAAFQAEGLDTNLNRYTPVRSPFAGTSIHERNFPIRAEDFSEGSAVVERARHGFPNYQTFTTLKLLASQAYREGDWVKAAEYCLWNRAYADAALADPERGTRFLRGEWERDFGVSTFLLSKILAHCGLEEQALGIVEDLIKRNYTWAYEGREHNKALRVQEDLLFKLGRSNAGSVARLEAVAQHAKNNVFVSREGYASCFASYVRVLHKFVSADQAWDMIEQFYKDAQTEDLRSIALRVMIGMALDEGRTEGVEDWLKTLLLHYRSKGNKANELWLYQKYAQLLALRGSFAEATQMQTECIRLAKAYELDSRVAGLTDQLAQYRAGRTTNKASPTRLHAAGISLAPSLVTTIPLPEHKAYATFTLSNLTEDTIKGTLSATGMNASNWDESAGVWHVAEVANVTPVAMQSLQVELAPAEQLLVNLSADASKAGKAKLVWTAASRSSASSSWTYEAGQGGDAVAIINANEARENPFYLVPLYHYLQKISTADMEFVDVRVKASSACYIEIYDSYTGQLVAIDSQSNGAWNNAGDVIAMDRNNNGQPDIGLRKADPAGAMQLYFKTDAISSEPLDISIDILVDGVWRTQVINTIHPASKM